MTRYLQLRKQLSLSIIISVYIAFVGYLLGQSQGIADWSYSLHEMMFIPMTIAIFLVPVLFLVWLYAAYKSLKENNEKVDNRKKLYVRNGILLVSLLMIFAFFYYESYGVQTGGVFIVEEKIHHDGNYYLVLNDKKVLCSNNEYNLVVKDQQYLISFEWNKLRPDRGILNYIEIAD